MNDPVSDFRPQSFETFLRRPAPSHLIGRTLGGESVAIAPHRLTLVVAVKEHCDGCRAFIEEDLVELNVVDVVVVAASVTNDAEWINATSRVIIGPEILDALDMHAPPTYVLIDPEQHLVVCEGVLFSPAQVAREIEPFLRS
jgi:hypothetical protein